MTARAIIDLQSASFKTKRLAIRCCRVQDAISLSALMSPEISKWVAAWPFPLSTKRCEQILISNLAAAQEGKIFPGVMTQTDTGQTIGWIKIDASDEDHRNVELGYWIGEEFQGHGYGFEAAKGAVDFAFSILDATTVRAGAQLANTASHELLRKLGMTEDSEVEVWAPSRQRMETCRYWKLDRPE